MSAILLCSVFSTTASALSGQDFRAGNIIADGVFYNSSSMSAPEIQNFLEVKVPDCDTTGQKMHSSGMTRAQYGASKGQPAPYICLKSYTQHTPDKPAEQNLCSAYKGGLKSAATVIYDVARACGVSPKVLLVLLQKEQSLVTSDWPWQDEYQKATGYACPDTASCNPAYAGFFNQVYYAARVYKYYAANAFSFNHRAGRVNSVRYHPNTACGSSSVYIESQATAGLYNYTPYQPNQAALNNLYGTGDGCSAYGNRNFWRIFSDWFGSTLVSSCTFPSSTGNQIYRLLQPNRNSYLLTSNPGEVCDATGRYGFLYDGVIAYSSNQGNGVYRLQKNGNYLYTTSYAEAQSATVNYGFTIEGIAFTGSTVQDNEKNLPVHRLNYPLTGGYFYTLSDTERDVMVKNYGFKYEGIGFYINNTAGLTLYDVHRLAHPNAGYLFTTSTSERDAAVQHYGFRSEGVGFRTRTGFTIDNLPVYRLASSRGYVLTTSLGERKHAIQLGYRSEGIAFYSYPTTNLGASKQVFRLAHPNGAYLYTTSASEKDSAISKYGYRFEGIGFRVP
jgi:hypothetical protein